MSDYTYPDSEGATEEEPFASAGALYTVKRTDYLTEGRDKTKVTVVQNDPMGRAAHSWTTLADERVGGNVTTWKIFVKKTFDELGRVKQEYFPQKVEADDWSVASKNDLEVVRHEYDSLGREVKTFTPRPTINAACNTEVVFGVDASVSRTTQTVYDEEGRWRILCRDGLGRIVRVYEPDPGVTNPNPNNPYHQWLTEYEYDELDNLRFVKKHGTNSDIQEREFTYDALGRLTFARLPEYNDNRMQYLYDDLGNMTWKQIFEGETYTENLSYDGLGRLLQRTTDLGGTVVTYTFDYDERDGIAFPTGFNPQGPTYGRLVADKVWYDDNTVIERFYDYDWQGRVVQKMDRLGIQAGSAVSGETFSAGYEYTLGGLPTETTYPSGQRITFQYGDNGGMLTNMGLNDIRFLDIESYHAGGAAAAMTLYNSSGDETADWVQTLNNRKWPEKIMAGIVVQPDDPAGLHMFGLLYDDYADNGNILSMDRYLKTTSSADASHFSFVYEYDFLNRLNKFEFQDYGPNGAAMDYEYRMDEYGNLCDGDGVPARNLKTDEEEGLPGDLSVVVDPATNRIQTAGAGYDVLGNLKETTNEDGIDLTLSYMDQGHVLKVKDPDSGDTLFRYYYDADGQRRIKAREEDNIFANSSFYFYKGNDLICQLDRGEEVQDDNAYQPKFLLLDHLGTTRAELKFVEDEDTGVVTPTIATGYDYMPYGELITEDHLVEYHPDPNPRTEQVLFTGKPRDKESGLDYFGARFYGNNLLRWISPDQPFADNHIANPQSWNLYQYVSNNPINSIDALGRLEIKLTNNSALSYDLKYDTYMQTGLDWGGRLPTPGLPRIFRITKYAIQAIAWKFKPGDNVEMSFKGALNSAELPVGLRGDRTVKLTDAQKEAFGSTNEFEGRILKAYEKKDISEGPYQMGIEKQGRTGYGGGESDVDRMSDSINETIRQTLKKAKAAGISDEILKSVKKALEEEYNVREKIKDLSKSNK